MKKILKRVTAMCCATIMAASMMAIGAGAKTTPIEQGAYTMRCTSYQMNSHTWMISTSINKQSSYVFVSGTGHYYTNRANTKSTGNGRSSDTSGVDCTLYSSYGYGWKYCKSTHSTRNGSYTWTVNGRFVDA